MNLEGYQYPPSIFCFCFCYLLQTNSQTQNKSQYKQIKQDQDFLGAWATQTGLEMGRVPSIKPGHQVLRSITCFAAWTWTSPKTYLKNDSLEQLGLQSPFWSQVDHVSFWDSENRDKPWIWVPNWNQSQAPQVDKLLFNWKVFCGLPLA